MQDRGQMLCQGQRQVLWGPLRLLLGRLLLLSVSPVAAWEWPSWLPFGGVDLKSVTPLTNQTFDAFIKENPQSLVKFYMDSCGHCKKLEPVFAQAAGTLKAEGVPLAKVDVMQEQELAERYKIEGLPTLIWFDKGDAVKFESDRTSQGIVEMARSMKSSPVVQVPELPPLAGDRFSVTLFAAERPRAYERLAVVNRNKADFFHVRTDQGKNSRLVVQHRKEPASEVTDVDVEDFAALERFWAENNFPMFGVMDANSIGSYLSRFNAEGEKMGVIWGLFKMEAGLMEVVADKYRPMMLEVAKHYKGRYSVIITDTHEFDVGRLFGSGIEFPRIGVTAWTENQKYKQKLLYDGELTAQKIIAWIDEAIASGLASNVVKSEPIPETNDEPVRVVVGKTLEAEVFRDDADVLLEVHAPWCHHCKGLAPIYTEIGRAVKRVSAQDSLVIAKMDGTANDSPVQSLKWDGFPSLFFIAAGSREAVELTEVEPSFKSIVDALKERVSKDSVREALEGAADERGDEEIADAYKTTFPEDEL